MSNPYETPKYRFRYAPFRKRFRRALSRARAEYKAGLERQGVSRRDHVLSWLSLLVALFIVLLIAVAVILSLLA